MDAQLASLISSYQPTHETAELVRKVPKVFLVGIAAAGKNVLLRKLLETGKFYEIVTYTTRPPRTNNGKAEQNGVEYYFIDMAKAISMLENHEFVEAKWIHRQNLYGTVAREFQKASEQGKVAIADVDVRGVDEYIEIARETTKPIFVLPPDFDTWQQRFKARYEGRLGEGEFQRRLHTAAQEIEHVLSKDYYSIVINDNLEDASTQVMAIANGEPQPEAAWRRGSQVAHKLLEAIRSSTR